MIKIKKLIGKVRSLARKFPDFVYAPPILRGKSCSYVAGGDSHFKGQRGCIFGQALLSLGVSKAQLKRFDTHHFGGGVDIQGVLEDLKIKVDEKQTVWCGVVWFNKDKTAVVLGAQQ